VRHCRPAKQRLWLGPGRYSCRCDRWRHAYSYAYSNSYTYSNANGYAYGDTERESYTYRYGDGHAYGYPTGGTKAPANTASSADSAVIAEKPMADG
jgi:hypothetical protein